MFIVVVNGWRHIFHAVLPIKTVLNFYCASSLLHIDLLLRVERKKERERETRRVRGHKINVKSKRIVNVREYCTRICALRAFVRATSLNPTLCHSWSRVYDNRCLFFAGIIEETDASLCLKHYPRITDGNWKRPDREEKTSSLVTGAVRGQIFTAERYVFIRAWGESSSREHITPEYR